MEDLLGQRVSGLEEQWIVHVTPVFEDGQVIPGIEGFVFATTGEDWDVPEFLRVRPGVTYEVAVTAGAEGYVTDRSRTTVENADALVDVVRAIGDAYCTVGEPRFHG